MKKKVARQDTKGSQPSHSFSIEERGIAGALALYRKIKYLHGDLLYMILRSFHYGYLSLP